jgi:hypothetical protein
MGCYNDWEQVKLQEDGENCIKRSIKILTSPQCFLGDQVREGGIGGACSTLERREKRVRFREIKRQSGIYIYFFVG